MRARLHLHFHSSVVATPYLFKIECVAVGACIHRTEVSTSWIVKSGLNDAYLATGQFLGKIAQPE